MVQHAMGSMKQWLATIIVASIGGMIFSLLHIPVPWLLGPMVAIVISTNVFKYEQFRWHHTLRNIGLVMIGYTIGLSMTAEALYQLSKNIPYMFTFSVILLLLCAGIAYVVTKLSAVDYETAFLASIPGGLSQVLMIAEEAKGINFAVVAVTQITRIMIIMVTMPIVVLIPLFRDPEGSGGVGEIATVVNTSFFPNIFYFGLACIVAVFIGKKIKLPTSQLLAPIIATAGLQFLIPGPELPELLLNAAQFMIGTHVGLLLRTKDLPSKKRTLSLAFISGSLLVICSIMLSFVLVKLQPLSHATSLLSLAPGGQDQMGIVALEVNADVSIVAGYQFFRTLFIYIVVPPLMFLLFKRRQTKQRSKKSGIPT